MRYALLTLWFERRRFLPGMLAVAFSSLLTILQAGIFWGLVSVVSMPIVHSPAAIWVTYPDTLACDLGKPIPTYWADILWAQPEITAVDQFIEGMTFWTTTSGVNELIIVLGCNLEGNSLGPMDLLTAKQRSLLTEPGAVILDEQDCQRLEVEQVGAAAEVFGHRVRVAGFVRGMGSISGPYVLCSLETARTLLRIRQEQATYLLAAVRPDASPAAVVQSLRQFPRLSAFTADEFSLRSKVHWFTKTKAGVAVIFVAFLGLCVGASVTSQTLYAATVSSLKELAVLRAMGIPRWRMNLLIVQQSMAVGIIGLALGIPLTFILAQLARRLGTNALIPPELLLAGAAITLAMALFSGLLALRSLRLVEPAALLRA